MWIFVSDILYFYLIEWKEEKNKKKKEKHRRNECKKKHHIHKNREMNCKQKLQ